MGQISKSKDTSLTEIQDVLKQHGELFQEVLKYSSDGINICQTDAQGAKRRLVMCNDRFVQMSGRSRQELMASESLNEFVEDVGTPPERFTKQDLGKGKEARGICSWKRPDGKENYYEYVGALVETEGDKLLVLGIDRDITQRMKLQRELAERNELLEKTLQNCSDGINVVEGDIKTRARRLVFCNDRFVEMSGYTREQLMAAEDLNKLVHNIYSPSPDQIHEIKEGIPNEGLASWKRPDGKENLHEYRTALLENRGEKLLVMGIDRDITEQRKTQEELQKTTKLFQQLLKQSTDGICLAEFDPVTRSRRAVTCNDRFVEMAGRSREELMAAEDLRVFGGTVEYPEGYVQQKLTPDQAGTGLSAWARPDGRENYHEYVAAVVGVVTDGKWLVMTIDRDITSRREAEEALRQSEERFRLIAETVQDVFWIVDPGTMKVIYLSPAFEDLFGIPAEKAYESQRALTDLIHPEDLPRLEAAREELAKSDRLGVEFRIVRPDGTIRWIRGTGSAVRDAEGNLQRITGSARDITARKEAVEALQERTQLFDSILKHSTDGINISRKNAKTGVRRLVLCNDRYVEMSGRTREELMGSEDLSEFVKTVQVLPFEASKEQLRRGLPTRGISSWIRPDGKENYYEYVGSLLGTEGDELVILGIDRDITEQKKARDELRERNELLEKILTFSSDAINIVRKNAKTGARRLVLCNDRYVEMSGRTRKELMGAEDLREFQRAIQAPALEDINEQLRRGQPSRGIGSWIRPDGTENHYEYVGSLIASEGDELLTLGIDRDITEREKMEQHLRNVAKMEAVGKLAGGIAHDFNNQLTVVKGYCDLLLKDTSAEKSTRSAILEILNAAKRAETLTSQLLAFSREQMLRPEVINLNTILNALSGPLSHMISEDIRIAIVLGESLANVKADAGQVEQAIMNLVVNASDAMPTGGTLTIQTANADLDENFVRQNPGASVGSHVMLAIADTGVGMDDETAKHIFEPFFTTKGVGEGTGLGLPMVYGFVKQSDGYVQVQSSPGEGATFRLYLPQIYEPVRVHVEAPASSRRLKGSETILVAEDEDAVRQLVVNVLSQYGYTVLQGSSAKEALPLGEHYDGTIDLLIADVVMPEMSGPDLYKELSKVRPNIKKLYISGYAEKTIVEQKKLTVGSNLLTKPFRPQELAQKVRDLLDNR